MTEVKRIGANAAETELLTVAPIKSKAAPDQTNHNPTGGGQVQTTKVPEECFEKTQVTTRLALPAKLV